MRQSKKLEGAAKDDLTVTLVARAPDSPVTDAVRRHADRFGALGVEVRVVFCIDRARQRFCRFR